MPLLPEIAVSREQFTDCIEYGILCAANLNVHEATKLREVGSKATSALTGLYKWDACGCPAYKAGLVDPDDKDPLYSYTHSLSLFISSFDKICRMKFKLNEPARLLIKEEV